LDAGVEGGRAGVVGEQFAKDQARVDVGDDRPPCGQTPPVCQHHALRLAVFNRDGLHRRVEQHLPAFGLQQTGHGADEGVRATLADDHAEGLVGHGLQIREHRAARRVWRKVQMQPPSGHQRFEFVAVKVCVEKIAW